MTCPQCGSSNSDGRASCFACGATLGYNPSTLLAAQKGFRSPLYIIAMVFFGIHALFQFLGLIDGLERLEFVFDYMFDRDFFSGFNMFSNYLYSIAAIVFFVGMLVVVCSAGKSGHAVCMAGLITWLVAFSYQIIFSLINILDSYYSDEEDILILLLVFALQAPALVFGIICTKELKASSQTGVCKKNIYITGAVLSFVFAAFWFYPIAEEDLFLGLLIDRDMIIPNDLCLLLGAGLLGGFLLYYRTVGHIKAARPSFGYGYQPYGQPQYQAPQQPQYQVYGQPQYQAPQQPQYQAPQQPQYQAPQQPQYQVYGQPQYQAPQQPQYQAPQQPQEQPPQTF